MPCPFCGWDATVYYESQMFTGPHVECSNEKCAVSTQEYFDKAAAIAAWNTRAPAAEAGAVRDGDAALSALVAELDEMERKATEGPWRHEGPDPFDDYNIMPPTQGGGAIAAVVSNGRPAAEVGANAALITLLRNAWPTLRDAVRGKS